MWRDRNLFDKNGEPTRRKETDVHLKDESEVLGQVYDRVEV